MVTLSLATAPAVAQVSPAAEAAAASQLVALLETAERQLESSQFAAARQNLEEAACLATRLSNDTSLAKAWTGLARADWATGENARALEFDERALEIRSRLGDPEPLALALNNVGLDLYSTARHGEALDYYDAGLEQAVTPSTRALLLMNIGLVFRYQGRFAEAEGVLQEALAIRRAEDKPRQTALVLNALGILARITGRYADALAYHGQALALRREEKDRFGQAQSLNNLATVYGDQGEIEQSLEIHREALRIALEIGYTRQIGLSHENIAAELDDLGRPKEAFGEAQEAIALYRRTNDRSNLANSLSNAGGYLVELGRLSEARPLLTEALALGRELEEPEMEIVSLQGLGEADLVDARPAEALASLDAALSIAEKAGFRGLEWKLRFDRARALSSLGRRDESFDDLQASIRTINALRTQIGTDAGKIGFVDVCQAVFERLAVELFSAGREREALEIAEAGRARALADLLSQRQIVGKPADRLALAQLRDAQARTRTAESAAAGGGEGARGGEVRAAVDRLRDQNPELASLVAVESPAFDEIRATARRLGATLVEYLSASDACYAWVVTPTGELETFRREIGREKLAGRIRSLRDGLESADLARPLSRPLAAELRELDALLIAPLERWLPRSPNELVVIVPHGPLVLLPFAALTDRRGRALVARHTLVFAPAVSTFRYTARKVRGRSGRVSGRGLVVADPAPPSGSGLAALPGARAEAASVAGHLGGGTLLLSGRRATEAAVKRAAPDRAVLHFATHGLISEERPLASSLALAEGEGEDGYLRVDEVFGLDLHAELVVLSGCRTGLGRLSGDGILGLTRAFLYAGTPSIVVSEWDVSDRATICVMDRFYAELVAGLGKARALREAQLEARRRFPHPAAWSAFVLVGEPR